MQTSNDMSLTVPDPLAPLALLGLLTRKNREKNLLCVCRQLLMERNFAI